MKFLSSIFLTIVLGTSTVLGAFQVELVEYEMTGSEKKAYGYKAFEVLAARPTEQIMMDKVKLAMTQMQDDWKKNNRDASMPNGVPHVMALFWPGDADMKIYMHSSIKGAKKGTAAIKNFKDGNINPVIDAALQACLEAQTGGHTNNANCAEMVLLNRYAQINKIASFKEKTDALIVAANWSTKTGKAHIMAPCEGEDGSDEFGCRDVLKELGIYWCDWKGRAMERRSLAIDGHPRSGNSNTVAGVARIVHARRGMRAIMARSEAAPTAAELTAMVGSSKIRTCPNTMVLAVSGGGKACPMRMRRRFVKRAPGDEKKKKGTKGAALEDETECVDVGAAAKKKKTTTTGSTKKTTEKEKEKAAAKGGSGSGKQKVVDTTKKTTGKGAAKDTKPAKKGSKDE